MTKKEARECMKELRKRLPQQEREKKNSQIKQNLFQIEAMKRAQYFFPFVSYGTEVDTIEIIQEVLARGNCKVAVPKVHGDDMDFYTIESLKQLQKGYRGILEPIEGEKILAENGVMLLPGLAFDSRKNRVGYGGGYYDRYLDRVTSDKLVTVALAYEFQIAGVIEAEQFDRSPQWIVTEEGVF